MKRVYLFLLFLCCSLMALPQSPSFVKVWESSDSLCTPESALYHKKSNKIYVSNIAGKGWDIDSVGFISKLSAEGKIEQLKFADGLNAPKGMAIYKSFLYVADIDRLVKIDLLTGKILANYRHPKAVALNDVDVDKDGSVYVTDSNNKRIFCLQDESLSLFLESEVLLRVNGILIEKNNLLCGVADSAFIAIDKKTKSINTLMTGVGYLDGIIKVGKGTYIVSNFKGKVSLLSLGKTVELLLDTTPLEIKAADLGYISDSGLVLVPTFHANRIVAYKYIRK